MKKQSISRDELRKMSFDRFYPEAAERLYMTSREREALADKLGSGKRNFVARLMRICSERAGNDNPNLSVYIGTRCGLSESAFRKVVLKKTRNVTEEFLGRICVGLGLSLDESESLFFELGKPLVREGSAFAAVTLYALENHSSIDEYIEDLEYFKKLF